MRWLWLAFVGALFLAGGQARAAAPPIPALPPLVVDVPPLPAGKTPAPMKFARAAFQVPDGAVWGYMGVGITCRLVMSPMKWRASNIDPDNARLASIFREELSSSGFAGAQNANLFDQGPKTDRYQVAALITGLDSRYCETPPQYPPRQSAGTLKLTIEWQLYDNLRGEVIGRFETTSTGQQRLSPDAVERTFYGGFRNGVRTLLANSAFREAVTASSSAPPPVTLEPVRYAAAPPAKRTIASSASAVAAIFTGDGHGSGFLISKDGYLLTNQHVVGGAKYVKVRWSDGAETVGEVVRTDRRRDVAIIKADPGGRAPLSLRGGVATLGEPVFAIGTPLDAKFQGSVTKGVMSASRVYDGLPFIQSDVVINNGNSGGPLLDESGAVIGICVSGWEINGAPVGINLFIPIDDALKALALSPA